jgi:CubicO group peptidase (beta-lactamase class C family)
VPGLAIVVVQGGRTLLCEGYGQRNVARDLPVTPETLFALASVTKAFTAAAVGILADEKKLEWDKPVREYLPSFRLHDAVASERVTPRDLLCHRTGLPRHDNVWYGTSADRWVLLDRLRYLEPSKDLRARWEYQNLMYMTAGLVIEQITGLTWAQFVTERIISPLGMSRTNVDVAVSAEDADFAAPYRRSRGRAVRTKFYEQGPILPAGGINSCVADLARWLRMNLGAGRLGKRRIVSEESMRQIHTPVMVVPEPPVWPELQHPSYALGWQIQPYRGHLVLRHGGNIRGFSSLAWLMPRQKIGMAVLTNQTGQPVPTLVAYQAADLLLGQGPAPWLRRFKKAAAKQDKAEAEQKRKFSRERIRGTRPSHRLSDYVGDYEHPGYGTLNVTMRGQKLRASYNDAAGPLRHYHYDVFACDALFMRPRTRFSFQSDDQGRIDRVSIPVQDGVAPIVFRRREPTEGDKAEKPRRGKRRKRLNSAARKR